MMHHQAPAAQRVGGLRLLAGGAALSDHLAAHGPLGALDGRIIDVVGEAGLRGRGGAGFPTAQKLAAVALGSGRHVVVGNGTEGEPLSSKDGTLMRCAPHLVLDGLAVAGAAVGAERAVLCVASGRGDLVATLGAAAAERDDRVRVEIKEAPARYVSGQESALVSWIGGGQAKPTGRRPDRSGVDGHPTLVDNVETLANLALIARFGPTWYRSVGTIDDPGTRLVTVGCGVDRGGVDRGGVDRGGVYEIPTGYPLAALLAQTATGDHRTRSIRAVLLGGYYGRWVDGIEADAVRLGSANLGAGVVVPVDDDLCAVHEVARVASWFAANSARQCGPCVFGLSDIAAAAASIDAGADVPLAHEDLVRWSGAVRRRGACHLPDGAAGFIDSALRVFAGEITEHHLGRCARPRRSMLSTPAPEVW
jgi:NADH:ubiquinone oxidoreductase subunit F (NADH-binding)